MSAETTIDYLVTGMTCGHCERAVTDEVSRVPGVTGVDVSAASGRLTIATDGPVVGGGWLRRALRNQWSSLTAEPRVTRAGDFVLLNQE